MDRGAWQTAVHGVARVGHNLVTKPQPSPPLSFGASYSPPTSSICHTCNSADVLHSLLYLPLSLCYFFYQGHFLPLSLHTEALLIL